MLLLLLVLVSFDSHEYTATIDGDQGNTGPGGLSPYSSPSKTHTRKCKEGVALKISRSWQLDTPTPAKTLLKQEGLQLAKSGFRDLHPINHRCT